MNLLELVLIGTVVVSLACSPPVRTYVRSLPLPARLALALFVALLASGHLARIDRWTFPFVGWRMYGVERKPQEIVYERYFGITVSGRRVTLSPTDAFPSLTKGRIRSPLARHVALAPGDDQSWQKASALLTAIARARNRDAPDDPLRTIVATRCRSSAEAWAPTGAFLCRDQLTIEIPPLPGP